MTDEQPSGTSSPHVYTRETLAVRLLKVGVVLSIRKVCGITLCVCIMFCKNGANLIPWCVVVCAYEIMSLLKTLPFIFLRCLVVCAYEITSLLKTFPIFFFAGLTSSPGVLLYVHNLIPVLSL